MFNDTCAVIVTYNPDFMEVKTLIERIRDHVASVVIIDNGSKNVDDLRSLPATLAELGENRGVATAQNFGIEMALANGYDFVLLFDHDSLPASDMVPKLREAYDALTQQGVRVAAVGANYIERNFGNIQEDSRRTGWVKKNMLISSGTLFSAEALRDVGPMQDDLFIEHIDTEWCERARRKWREHNYRLETQRCWKIYMVRDAIMGHSLGGGISRFLAGALSRGLFFSAITAAAVPRDFAPIAALSVLIVIFGTGFRHFVVHSPIRRYYTYRNTAYLIFHSPYSYSWKAWLALNYGNIFFAILLGAYPGKYWQYLRMMLLGIWHGIRGKLGPYPSPKLSSKRGLFTRRVS